jgi:hypothetical protein
MTGYGESAEIAADLDLEEATEPVPTWYRGVALTILVLSILTAISALLAGLAAHDTLLQRTEEIVDVAIAEDDQLTVELLRTKHDLQTALSQEVSEEELERITSIETETTQFADEADAEGASALTSAAHHLLFSLAATIAAVAIAVTGLAPIVHQRWLWAVGVVVGVVAAGFLTYGVIGLVA